MDDYKQGQVKVCSDERSLVRLVTTMTTMTVDCRMSDAREIGDDCRVAEEVCWARIREVIMGVWRLICLIIFRGSVNKSLSYPIYYDIQVIYYGVNNAHINIQLRLWHSLISW